MNYDNYQHFNYLRRKEGHFEKLVFSFVEEILPSIL